MDSVMLDFVLVADNRNVGDEIIGFIEENIRFKESLATLFPKELLKNPMDITSHAIVRCCGARGHKDFLPVDGFGYEIVLNSRLYVALHNLRLLMKII